MKDDKLLSFEPNNTVKYTKICKEISTEISNRLSRKEHHPFFTTTKLKRIDFDNGNYKLEARQNYIFLGESTWATYSRFYRHLILKLDKNIFQKSHLQPPTFDFLDVDGSRDLRATFSRTTIPHIHSIFLVHERTLGRWYGLMERQFEPVVAHRSVAPFVRSFHAKPVHDLPGAVAYAFKAYDLEQMRPIRDHYQLYSQQPISKEEKAALKERREAARRAEA